MFVILFDKGRLLESAYISAKLGSYNVDKFVVSKNKCVNYFDIGFRSDKSVESCGRIPVASGPGYRTTIGDLGAATTDSVIGNG
jgi:hypothetical protein